MRFGITVFPGTWSDQDCHQALGRVLGQEVSYIWHKDETLPPLDCIIVPGGFSYGDYLRAGAIARFSPIMPAIENFAKAGGLVFGICNGFQILCETGLLPGALLRNSHLEYRCEWVSLRVENNHTPFTRSCSAGQVLSIPISHGEGRYYADPETQSELERNNQIIFRYCSPEGDTSPEANPNGSLDNIAGVTNLTGNVIGMMPHPERACESLLGSDDGAALFKSIFSEHITK